MKKTVSLGVIALVVVFLALGFELNGGEWSFGDVDSFDQHDSYQELPRSSFDHDNVVSGDFVSSFEKAAGTWDSYGGTHLDFPLNPISPSTVSNIWSISEDGESAVYYAPLATKSSGADRTGRTVIVVNNGKIKEADIAFNRNLKWSDNPAFSEAYHMETVALHEIGHAIGIAHPKDDDNDGRIDVACGSTNPVMEGNVFKGEEHLRLKCDDKKAVDEIYKPNNTGGESDDDDDDGCAVSGAGTLSAIPPSNRESILEILRGKEENRNNSGIVMGVVARNEEVAQEVNSVAVKHRSALSSEKVRLSPSMVSDFQSLTSKIEKTLKSDTTQFVGASHRERVSDHLSIVRTRLDEVTGMTLSKAKRHLLRETNQFTLEGNFPNPATTYTKITYSLPETKHVEVTLYDVTGRLIRTIQEKQQSSGVHQVDVEVSDLASGTYIYRVNAGNQTKSGKLQVTR